MTKPKSAPRLKAGVPNAQGTIVRDAQGRVRITGKGLTLLTKHVSNGVSLKDISVELGVAHTTIAEHRRRYPEVEEAYQAGKGALETEITGHLMSLVRAGNVAATIFANKALLGRRDQGSQPVSKDGNINITTNTINIPAITPSMAERLGIPDLKTINGKTNK